MRQFARTFACAVVLFATVTSAVAQDEPEAPARGPRTMRPVIMGQQYAVSSMKHQATAAAVRILEAGGNAFDAAVAGQAVLALVDPASNGYGSDAVVLVYDAKTKKVVSINGGGTAPKLATIDWYKQNNGGKLPIDDGLLSATVPGVVDVWFAMLDQLGHDDVRAGAAAGDRSRRAGLSADARPRAFDGIGKAEEESVERKAVHA